MVSPSFPPSLPLLMFRLNYLAGCSFDAYPGLAPVLGGTFIGGPESIGKKGYELTKETASSHDVALACDARGRATESRMDVEGGVSSAPGLQRDKSSMDGAWSRSGSLRL